MNETSEVTWSRLRQLVKKRDESKCYHCGTIVENGHCDHLIPISKGGTDAIDNLVWSCKTCNLRKSNKILKRPGYELKLRKEIMPDWKNVLVSLIPFLTSLIIPPYPDCESPKFHDALHLFRQDKVETWLRDHLWPMSPGLIKAIRYKVQMDEFFDMIEIAYKNHRHEI